MAKTVKAYLMKGVNSASIPMPTVKTTRNINGKEVVVSSMPSEIRFENGMYKTSDPAKQARIEATPMFKSGQITEITQVEQKKAELKKSRNVEAGSRNEKLIYLLTECSAPADVLKDYTEAQLDQYAKLNFKVTFVQAVVPQVVPPNTDGNEPTNVPGINTVAEMKDYLINAQGATEAEVSGLKKDGLIAFAKTKYNIVFQANEV